MVGRMKVNPGSLPLNSDAVYPMNCVPDVITASKAGVSSALPPADVSASIGASWGGIAT